MESLLEHSLAWCRGEIVEGRLIALGALLVLFAAGSLWLWGATPVARSLVLPLAVVGLVFGGIGVTLMSSNPARIVAFTEAHSSDPAAFARAERERTDAFIAWYPRTAAISAALVGLALVAYLFLHAPLARSIALAVMLLGFGVLVIDHFSEERARAYARHIPALD